MDLEAVRTFVACAAAGRFSDAADERRISQQAVSKRVAALERELGVRLFARTGRGVRLSADGEAFLPHARALLAAGERAVAAVRPGARPLRVDVVGRHLAPAVLLHAFHRAHPGTGLDVVTLADGATATRDVRDGAVDAAFRAVPDPAGLPDGVVPAPVPAEPIELVVGPEHPLAGADRARPDDLAGHRIRMPGVVPGTEWAAFYDELARAFGLTLDVAGPNFGLDVLLDTGSDPGLATLVGGGMRLPDRPDLHRVPLHDPVPLYPHALLHRRDDRHPALAALRTHLAAAARRPGRRLTWTPPWPAASG